MKHGLYIFAILGLLLQPGFWFTPSTVYASSPAAPVAQPASGELPDYADPALPIPYHKAGYPSAMGSDTRAYLANSRQPWSSSFNILPAEQQTATLDYSADYDPFIGNYTLVNWDNLAIISEGTGSNGQRVRVYKQPAEGDNNLAQPADLNMVTGGANIGDTKTGDLTGDGIDEIVSITHNWTDMQIGNVSAKRFIGDVPAVASPSAGVFWQFVKGYDDQLWVMRDPAVGWKGLGGTLYSSPTAAFIETNRVDVLILASDSNVWRCQVTPTTQDCGEWEWLGGAPAGRGKFVGHPVLAAESKDRYDIFVRSSENLLWHLAWRNGSFGAWEEAGIGQIISSPAVTSQGGRIDLVATRPVGGLGYISRASDAAPWSGWVDLGGSSMSSPAIASPGPAMLDVFFTDTDRKILTKSFRNNAWSSGWTLISNVETYYGPAAVVEHNTERVVVLGHNLQGAVFGCERTTPAGSWAPVVGSGWTDGALPLLPQWGKVYTSDHFGLFGLGHFLPNGRMQAITYRWYSANQTLILYPFKFVGGYEPVQMQDASLSGVDGIDVTSYLLHTTSPDFWKEKVGDYDGDGVEELAILMAGSGFTDLYVFQIREVDKVINGTPKRVVELYKSASLNIQSSRPAVIDLLSGQFKAEATAEEELVVVKDGLAVVELSSTWTLSIGATSLIDWWSGVIAWAFTSGDFVTELDPAQKVDEIAYSAIEFRDDYCYGLLCIEKRDSYWLKTRMYQINGDSFLRMNDPEDKDLGSDWPAEPDYEMSMRIASADLRRNGKAGVGILVVRGSELAQPNGIGSSRKLYTLEYDNASSKLVQKYFSEFDGGDIHQATGQLISGNLLGEGLRLMKPTYRMVPNLVVPIAWINAPPQVYDLNYVNPDPAYFGDKHIVNPYSFAKITVSSIAEESIQIEAKSRWNLDVNGSVTLGDPKATYARFSLGASYGQDFSRMTENKFSYRYDVSYQRKVDYMLYGMTDYHFYEYGLVSGEDLVSAPSFWPANQNSIEVFWTDVTIPVNRAEKTISVKEIPTSTCGHAFNPGHDFRNLLSYPTDARDMLGYNPVDFLAGGQEVNPGSVTASFALSLTEINTEKLSRTVKFSVSAGIELGLGWKSPVEGGVDLSRQIQVSIKGTYEMGSTETTSLATGKSVKVEGAVEPFKGTGVDKYTHYIYPYFYYNGTTLVLNYLTREGNTTWWNGAGADSGGWTKPDLAFVRPWSLLSSCLDAQGQNQADYSPEITFDKGVAFAGEKVKVSATVHNYSLNPVSNVEIEFWKGDPASGGTQITCDTPQANISIDDRGPVKLGDLKDGKRVENVSCTFTATGTGEQRIYIIADPHNLIGEHFEDNNKAYGLLTVPLPGSANGADPGMNFEKEGIVLDQSTSITPSPILNSAASPQAGTTQYEFFVPYNTLTDSATTEFKLDPAIMYGHAFTISNIRLDTDNVTWTSMPRVFGLDSNGNRDHNVPTAWVKITYPESDVSPGSFEEAALKLYYRQADGKWADNAAICGADVLRNPDANQVEAPICRTGTYVLASTPPPINVFVPFLRK